MYASPHDNIKGLLEVRGLGIMNFDYVEHSKIELVVELVYEFERMPDDERITILNKDLPLLKINPFHSSAPLKVKLALTGSL
ncbi:MAG: hypothetical protein BWY78_01517 [Alphaproteobacteria bacterium ADurb.Bin438]|nr:MAG: hypothetical protein BWY78_01517 [Alphaproteobacteria bacterium ADurb.Bin438]